MALTVYTASHNALLSSNPSAFVEQQVAVTVISALPTPSVLEFGHIKYGCTAEESEVRVAVHCGRGFTCLDIKPENYDVKYVHTNDYVQLRGIYFIYTKHSY